MTQGGYERLQQTPGFAVFHHRTVQFARQYLRYTWQLFTSTTEDVFLNQEPNSKYDYVPHFHFYIPKPQLYNPLLRADHNDRRRQATLCGHAYCLFVCITHLLKITSSVAHNADYSCTLFNWKFLCCLWIGPFHQPPPLFCLQSTRELQHLLRAITFGISNLPTLGRIICPPPLLRLAVALIEKRPGHWECDPCYCPSPFATPVGNLVPMPHHCKNRDTRPSGVSSQI